MRARDAIRPLTGEPLLAAWEAGATGHELRRPLALLAAAIPGADQAALGALPLAELDLALLQLRERTFGPELTVFASCPRCAESMEFTLHAPDLAKDLDAACDAASNGPVEWAEGDRRYRLRPVTTDDLIAALAAPDLQVAQDFLLARCVEAIGEHHAERSQSPAERSRSPAKSAPFSPGVRERFEELHADAELRCVVECPGCAGQQVLDLDIARFMWREVAAAAGRLLREVHLLATAYGWREQDILALSPRRRAAYLELAGA
jgi:hypothetical protein